jgi:hypothetical protein
MSAPEHDPNAALEVKQVEEVFTNYCRLLNVHVGGKVIQSTDEHPFYVKNKGWTSAKDLQIGDLLRSHHERWLPVDDLCDSGEDVQVYNLWIADYHTYFVGSREWGFSVWAHNACIYNVIDPSTGKTVYVGVANRGLTKTLPQRLRAAFKKTGIQGKVIPGTENISPSLAEAGEKAIIKKLGRAGIDDGGILINVRPGVNVNPTNIAIGNAFLKSIGLAGF